MAKNKIKAEDLEDEKDLDEEELDESEEDEDEDGGEEEKESEVKEKEESDSEDDGSEAEEEDSSEEEKAKQEALEEKRARRRREKKLKRERERRERAQLENVVVAMAEEIKKLKDGQGEVGKKFEGFNAEKIASEISELAKIYKKAERAMEEAISDGDGAKFAQAKQISDKAWARYTFLEAQKRQRPTPTSDDKQDTEKHSARNDSAGSADDASEGIKLGKDGKRYGIAFVNKHKSWYSPNGDNRDSKVVLAIDTDLYNEGYDPESKEYWEELEDRCKEYLPHRFKSVDAKRAKPKSTVGGGAGDHSPAGGAEKSLPKEFVQTLKAAGYWDDAEKRKAAIKNYYSNRKGA